jgi:hypothetical protein
VDGLGYNNMGMIISPNLTKTGLVLSFDAGNPRSFRGEPTTNLIPSPTVNAYPTVGNGWGTYNTNQYGNGNFFSIGTVSSVSSNIVTMTAAHSLQSYDVMRPQTTGGGVTANVDYLIKKVSSTQFSLHEYNSSQDGTQGYINLATGNHKVYDAFMNDTRISINSTNFPTMWWGAPHLPNSGLVKELRTNGFTHPDTGVVTDSIRLHYIRTDDVKDGMSYNVDASVTANSPVTVSFYTKASVTSAVGKTIQYYIYNYTGGSATAYSWNFTLGQVGVWERQVFTYTPAYGTMISYWFPQSGGVYSWEWSNMQVEQRSSATAFVAGTRGTTATTGGGLLNLINTGSNGELVNGVAYSSINGGTLVFDGSNDYISNISNTGITHGTSNFSYFAWVNLQGKPVYGTIFENGSWTSCLLIRYETDGITIYSMGTYWGKFSFNPSLNTWNHLGFIRDGNVINFYVNGVYQTNLSFTANISPSSNIFIGTSQHSTGQVFNGYIASAQIYTRALSATEVTQNFEVQRARFGV